MIIKEPCEYQKMKFESYIWKDNLIPALLIILILVWKLGKQIWAYNVFNEYKAVANMGSSIKYVRSETLIPRLNLMFWFDIS